MKKARGNIWLFRKEFVPSQPIYAVVARISKPEEWLRPAVQPYNN